VKLALALPLALGLLAMVTGCLATTMHRREETLTKSARELNDGLRWGRYDRVSTYLPADEAQALATRTADLGEDFAMADHEITAIKLAPGSDKATVTAEFTWYNQRRALVKKSTVEQRWEWTSGRWMLAHQRRIRGDRFPLVPEPIQPDPSPRPSPPGRGEGEE
jgi:hypothetical protein